jgi:zinc protease
LGALQGMLRDISDYNLPADYAEQEVAFIRNYNKDQHLQLAQKYLKPENMYFVIAGDAATQMQALESVGMGS